MDKILKWLTPILVIVLGVLVLVGGNTQSVLGGSTSATWTAANLVSLGTLTVGSGGTAMAGYKCATASWNPGAVNPTSTAETSVTLSGATLGDRILTSIDLSQQTLDLNAFASTTDTVVARLSQPDADLVTSVDIATTTVKVCYIR